MEPTKKTPMAAQKPEENNGGGGMENPAEAAIASWVAHFTGAVVAAGKESMLAVMRGQWRPPAVDAAAMGGGDGYHGTRPNDNNMPSATHIMKTETETNKTCELCKVHYTSLVMIKEHESGKRHQKNLRKSQKPEAVNNNDSNTNTIIQQPEEATKKKNPKPMKRAIKPKTDEEQGKTEPSKKQKVEKTQSEMPFKCYICSVKCNGKKAFDRHLCGKKHKSKVRSHWTKERTVLGLQVVYPPPQITGVSASSSLNGFS